MPARHQQDGVRHVVGVQRFRGVNDPRSCPGGPRSRQGVRQAPGQAQDDAVQIDRIRAALDEGRGVRETTRLLKVSPAKVSEMRRIAAPITTIGSVRDDQRLP
jgi:hypothetical protein